MKNKISQKKFWKYAMLLLLSLFSVRCMSQKICILFVQEGCVGVCLSPFRSRDTLVDKSKLLGYDFRLFQQTPAWELAKAVEDNDPEKIEYYVRQKKVPVDFQERRFGQTLLMLAVWHQNYEAAKKLLELGADPNKQAGKLGDYYAPMTYAAERHEAKYIKLLLKHGGDPNLEGKEACFPLICALQSEGETFERVKALVEAGADINHPNPLPAALLFGRWDSILYLIGKGADYRSVMSTVGGKNYYIENELRFKMYPLGSKRYKAKMRVVEFLKKRGIDYRATPIPESMVEDAKSLYPDTWQEYLKKY